MVSDVSGFMVVQLIVFSVERSSQQPTQFWPSPGLVFSAVKETSVVGGCWQFFLRTGGVFLRRVKKRS